MSLLSEQEYQNELLKNIDLNISIIVENKTELSSDKWENLKTKAICE